MFLAYQPQKLEKENLMQLKIPRPSAQAKERGRNVYAELKRLQSNPITGWS